MSAKTGKKKLLNEIFDIFECLPTQNPTNQDSQLSWFFQITWKNVRNKKIGGSRELLLPGNDFQTSSTANYPKKQAGLGSLETNQRHETQAWGFFVCPSTYQLNII